jgi:hypothetical protein
MYDSFVFGWQHLEILALVVGATTVVVMLAVYDISYIS